jgi:hypothetical protein
MATKTSINSKSELSLQDQLFAVIKSKYADAEAKKINKDNFLDIYIPTISPGRGTHLFFNTVKGSIKIGYYTRDESFINKVVSIASNSIDGASNGLRIAGNPKFDDIQSATEAAIDFLSNIMNEKIDKTSNTNSQASPSNVKIEEINDDLINTFITNQVVDGLNEFLENHLINGEIVILTIDPKDFISVINEDAELSELVNIAGSVGVDSWIDLAEFVGKKEANSLKEEYEEEDPGGIVLLYCNGKYIYSFSNPKEDVTNENSTNDEDDDFDLDEILRELGYGDDEDENEAVELNEFTIKQILEEIKSDKTLSHIDISYYTKEFSDLTYTLNFKVNKLNIKISRVNWFNDSYWSGKIERKEIIEGLKNYLKTEDSSELIENYFHPDIIE